MSTRQFPADKRAVRRVRVKGRTTETAKSPPAKQTHPLYFIIHCVNTPPFFFVKVDLTFLNSFVNLLTSSRVGRDFPALS